MKRKIISIAVLASVTSTAYAADWGTAIGNVDNAPTQSNIEQYKQAVVDRVKDKETVTFSTDTQVGANNQSSEALSNNVTSSDWMKNINDTLTTHENTLVQHSSDINDLQVWTGTGGFTSAQDLHAQLSNDIQAVDTDLQGYKVDTDEELVRHETALQSATTYDGTLASALTATADNVAADSIGSSQIRNGSITSDDILDGTISGSDIGLGQVGNGHLAADAVTSDKVLDGTLTGMDLADESIDGTKVTGLTGADITDGTLTGDDILDGSLTGADVAADSLNGTHVTGLTGADIADGSITGLDVADNSLTGNDVLDGTLEINDLDAATQSSIESGGSSTLVNFVGEHYIQIDANQGCLWRFDAETRAATLYAKYRNRWSNATRFAIPEDGVYPQQSAQKMYTSRGSKYGVSAVWVNGGYLQCKDVARDGTIGTRLYGSQDLKE